MALLLAIVALTVVEIAAVVLVMLFGPHDQTTALVGVLIGIMGPVVASLLALWHAAGAKVAARNAEQLVRNGQPKEPGPGPPGGQAA